MFEKRVGLESGRRGITEKWTLCVFVCFILFESVSSCRVRFICMT